MKNQVEGILYSQILYGHILGVKFYTNECTHELRRFLSRIFQAVVLSLKNCDDFLYSLPSRVFDWIRGGCGCASVSRESISIHSSALSGIHATVVAVIEMWSMIRGRRWRGNPINLNFPLAYTPSRGTKGSRLALENVGLKDWRAWISISFLCRKERQKSYDMLLDLKFRRSEKSDQCRFCLSWL